MTIEALGVTLTGLGVLATLAATAWALWARRKELTYRTLDLSHPVAVDPAERGRVAVTYDGAPVDGLTFAVVEIANSGGQAVTSSEYERPLALEFVPAARVLTAVCTRRTPDDLDIAATVDGDTVR